MGFILYVSVPDMCQVSPHQEQIMEKPERPNVSSRINPGGDRVYRLDYKNPLTGKRVRSVVGSIKRDAEKKADQIYQEMMAKYVGEPQSTITQATIVTVIEEFFLSKENRVRPSTVNRYGIYMTNYMNFMSKKFPKVVNIDQIRDVHINIFLKFLKTEKTLVPTCIIDSNYVYCRYETRTCNSFVKRRA